MTTPLRVTPRIQEALNSERYQHSVPLIQRRMEVLGLKSHGLPHAQIAHLVGVSENTLRDYCRLYEEGGIEKLKEVHIYRPESALHAHHSSLEAYRAHPPATIKEARSEIEVLTGIKRSATQVREFLKKKLHLRCRRVGMIPATADPEAQAVYLRQEIGPRLAPAQAGLRAVVFVDAAHFVVAPFLGILWSLARVFIRAPAGRHRFNVLGALNAFTHELLTVTTDPSITAQTVCELLRHLAALTLAVPLSVFLANARYQKCALVRTTTASFQLELCFLPPSSPNLNLIERLWQLVKKQCLYSQSYADFVTFKTALGACLSQTQTPHKAALASLLSLRFQLFEKAQLVPA